MTTSTTSTTGTAISKTQSKGYKDLIIWQRSMDLAAHIYGVTRSFPENELNGIAAQMRYAAVSVATGLAVGSKRGNRREFRDYILAACSTCTELETLTGIAHSLGYIKDVDMKKTRGMFIELFGMLYKFAAALKEQEKANAK